NFTISPFQVYFMIPGQVHTWDFEVIPDGMLVNFSTDFFQTFLLRPDYLQQFSFFNGLADDQVIHIPPGIQNKANDILEDLSEETKKGQGAGTDYLRILLLQLFLLIDQNRGHQRLHDASTTHMSLLKNFRSLVEIHFRQQKFPAFYADQLHVSSNHLNNLCK